MNEIKEVIEALRVVVNDTVNTPAPVRDWAYSLVASLHAYDSRQPAAADTTRYEKGAPLPTTLGALADEYADVRQARLDKDKESAGIKERETEIYDTILSALSESEDTGASGKHHRVQRVTKTVNNVADWPTLHAFIQQNNAFEMLQKRLADKAVTEFADANGALPPGVQAVDIATLSFTKI